MEQCRVCGNVFSSSVQAHHLQDCIASVQGNLAYLPDRFKHWRTLDEYREKWDFLPYSLKHRVAEQLMSFDYLWTLQDWLNPNRTIAKSQKILAIATIASIYEGILAAVVDTIITEKRLEDKLFDQVRHKPHMGWRFEQLISIARSADVYSQSWEAYLNRLREVRNWVHLNSKQKGELFVWIDAKSYQSLTNNLYKFHRIVEPHFPAVDN